MVACMWLQLGSEQSDTEADEDESAERADSASTDDDDEVFYDALDRSGSLGSISPSTSLEEAFAQNGAAAPTKAADDAR